MSNAEKLTLRRDKMKRNWLMNLMFLPLVAILGFTGCSDDDGDSGVQPNGMTTTFMVTIENESAAGEFPVSGVFNTPVGADAPGPLTPGNSYQFHFAALPGQKLHFVTMMVESNDLFYAPVDGLDLFDGGDNPITGDVTDHIALWDAGTELNQEPGVGSNQPLRQAGANTGTADTDNTVRMVDDEWDYPAVDDVIEVTLDYLGGHEFTLNIENISEAGTLMTSMGGELPVPLAPGVFAISGSDDALFSAGSADYGDGLEHIAEDGDPTMQAGVLAAATMYAIPLAPGAYAIHTDSMPIFSLGDAERGNGLEALAEDGDPSGLESSLSGLSEVSMAGVFNTPDGGAAPAPIFPGESYSFEFDAEPGEKLSFATMFVMSNDLFYGTDDDGLALFDSNDVPRDGDITQYVQLWDAGTEMNEWPGVGPNQAPFQTAANTGAVDSDNTVRAVGDMYMYPTANMVIKVTLTPIN
jgi:hypothetical protein